MSREATPAWNDENRPTFTFLKGSLNSAHAVQSNSARKRLHGPTLLSSPARRGHSNRMATIFSDARESVDKIPRPLASLPGQVPPLRIRPANDLDLALGYQALPSPPLRESPILYPVIEGDSTFERLVEIENHRRPNPAGPSTPMLRPKQRQEGQTPMSFLPPAAIPCPSSSKAPSSLTSPRKSFFETPPQIITAQGAPLHQSHTKSAQIVTMDEIARAQLWDQFSPSSAAWTDDSKFYHPPPKRVKPVPLPLPLPPSPTERKSSVPDWLENVPTPGSCHAEDEMDEGEEYPALSPLVEVERGSMRYKLRNRSPKKRYRDVEDDDIFA